MIILRIFIDKIPDTWEPHTVWYLAAIETLVEVFLISVVYAIIRF
jgi:hypothetical protein